MRGFPRALHRGALVALALLAALLRPFAAPAEDGNANTSEKNNESQTPAADASQSIPSAERDETGQSRLAWSRWEQVLNDGTRLPALRSISVIVPFLDDEGFGSLGDSSGADGKKPAADDGRHADGRKVRASLGVLSGVHLDTNANFHPSSGEFQIADPLGTGTVRLDARGGPNTDFGQFAVLDGRTRIRLPSRRVPSVTLQAAGVYDNQSEEDDLDLAGGALGVSTTYRGDHVEVTPQFSLGQTQLRGERYQRFADTELRVSHRFDGAFNLTGYVEGGARLEDFAEIPADAFADEQDGPVYEGSVGVHAMPFNDLALDIAYQFERKVADVAFESYEDHRIVVEATHRVTEGIRLWTLGNYAYRKYKGVEAFVSPNEVERDHILTLSGAMAVGVDRLETMAGLKDGGRWTENLDVILSSRYTHVNSNIPNFAFENARFEVAISKRFPF